MFVEIEQIRPRRDVGSIGRDLRSERIERDQTFAGRHVAERVAVEALDVTRSRKQMNVQISFISQDNS